MTTRKAFKMASGFDEALIAAASRYPGSHWHELGHAEQARAIYREMRRIDLAQVVADRNADSDTEAGGGV